MKRASELLLLFVALSGLTWVATPMMLIRPFGPQTPTGLSLAYAMRARGASLTVALLVTGLAAAIVLWPRLASWKGRTLAGLAVALLSGCAFMARSNYFEWMFNPLPHPGFVEAAQARDVADEDMVLGVAAGIEASAYPIRAMAYHHLVNDVIAGQPIVATY